MGAKSLSWLSRGKILAALRDGQSHVFVCPEGMTYQRLQGSLTADIAKLPVEIRLQYSQKRALLVTDEFELPQVCSIVSRKI